MLSPLKGGAVAEGSSLILKLLKDVGGDIKGPWRAVVRVDDSPAEVWAWEGRIDGKLTFHNTQYTSFLCSVVARDELTSCSCLCF